MIEFWFIIHQSLCNYLRGRGKLKWGLGSHVNYALFSGAGSGIYAAHYDFGWPFCLFALLGVLNWSVWAWGANGFPCIHGMDTRNYDDNKIIMPIVGWLTGFKKQTAMTEAECYLFGMTFFCVRGLCLAPMLIAMALYYKLYVLFLIPLCLLQGTIYGTMHFFVMGQYRVLVAEILQGALIGGILVLAGTAICAH